MVAVYGTALALERLPQGAITTTVRATTASSSIFQQTSQSVSNPHGLCSKLGFDEKKGTSVSRCIRSAASVRNPRICAERVCRSTCSCRNCRQQTEDNFSVGGRGAGLRHAITALQGSEWNVGSCFCWHSWTDGFFCAKAWETSARAENVHVRSVLLRQHDIQPDSRRLLRKKKKVCRC